MENLKTKFYTFGQNNSGGGFDRTDNVDEFVMIEAASANLANERAKEIGIYFDGVDDDIDCPCCGDRWYRVDEYDGYDFPSAYGVEPIEEYAAYSDGKAIIHYLDGTKKIVELKRKGA